MTLRFPRVLTTLAATASIVVSYQGCAYSVTTQPNTNSYGSLASLAVTESRASGDTSYTIGVAKFWDSGFQTNAVEVGSVTLDGAALRYMPTEKLYRADTNAFESSIQHTWIIIGKGAVPSTSATVVQPPLIKLTAPLPGAEIRQGQDFAVTWAPFVSGSTLFLQLSDESGHGYSVEPIDDGIFTVKGDITSGFRQGKITIAIYRQNHTHKTVDSKDLLFNGETKGILQAQLVP